MRRGIVAILALLVGWVVFKNLVYEAIIGKNDAQAIEPDYYFDEAWLERPDEQPSGGWETPWGVDIFVIAPPVTRPAPSGLIAADSPSLQEEYEAFAASADISGFSSPVYAATYRSPSPADAKSDREQHLETAATDVRNSMRRYLAADNLSRGLIILVAPGAEQLASEALLELPDDEGFRLRFGGVITSTDMEIPEISDNTGACSPAFEGCIRTVSITSKPSLMRFVLPGLRVPELSYMADADISSLLDGDVETLSTWLDENAVKPAEPFDTWAADEIVDVAPIRRPNQDEDISGERGN